MEGLGEFQTMDFQIFSWLVLMSILMFLLSAILSIVVLCGSLTFLQDNTGFGGPKYFPPLLSQAPSQQGSICIGSTMQLTCMCLQMTILLSSQGQLPFIPITINAQFGWSKSLIIQAVAVGIIVDYFLTNVVFAIAFVCSVKTVLKITIEDTTTWATPL